MFGSSPSYQFLFLLFHSLVWLAITSMVFLSAVYQKAGQNVLLRSLCFVIIILLLIIESPYLFLGLEPYNHTSFSDFSVIQAVVLNYCFLSVQAHTACILVNNCMLAMGWNYSDLEKFMNRSKIFILASYGLPLIPSGILVWSIADHVQDIVYPMYAFVPAKLMFRACTFWQAIFTFIGIAGIVILIYNTISVRLETMQLSSYSQNSRFQLFRLFLAAFSYLMISLGTLVPLLHLSFTPAMVDYIKPVKLPTLHQKLRDPWENQNLCLKAHLDPRYRYYQSVRCPAWLTFAPPFLAFFIFLMYGFGTPVRTALRQIRYAAKKAICRSKRKNSNMVNDVEEHFSDAYYSSDLSGISEEEEEMGDARSGAGKLNIRRRAQSI